MLDADEEAGRFKFMIGVIIFLCVSGYFSFEEFQYQTSGQFATAYITDIKEYSGGRRSSGGYMLHFDVQTETREFAGSDKISYSDRDHFNVHDEIEVEYIGTQFGQFPVSRIKGSGNVLWVAGFLLALAMILYNLFKIVRDVRETVSE